MQKETTDRLAKAARETLPLLVRLGDFIANEDRRCEIILEVREALEAYDKEVNVRYSTNKLRTVKELASQGEPLKELKQLPVDEQLMVRIRHACDRARYASNAIAEAEKFTKKGATKVALARLHIAINVLAAATQSASAACENLLEELADAL